MIIAFGSENTMPDITHKTPIGIEAGILQYKVQKGRLIFRYVYPNPQPHFQALRASL